MLNTSVLRPEQLIARLKQLILSIQSGVLPLLLHKSLKSGSYSAAPKGLYIPIELKSSELAGQFINYILVITVMDAIITD